MNATVERIYFSKNDTAMLLNLLENPPPPNAALAKAFERFMKAKYGTVHKSVPNPTNARPR